MKPARLSVYFFTLAALLVGCDKTPAHRLTDPAPEGAATQNSGSWTLYDEDVQTGGGFFLLPIPNANLNLIVGTEQTAAFGQRAIFFSWNGGDLTDPVNGVEHTFGGFGMLVAKTIDEMNATPAKDLSSDGFTTITFYAKGTLSENTILRAEGPGDGSSATILPRLDISQLTDTWTKYTIPNIPPAAFKSVRQYVNFTFVFTQPSGTTAAGNGAQVFLDRIAYEK